jgi:hypothetical protein
MQCQNVYLVHDIKPPNHEFCFPQFFQRIFLCLTREKENKLFTGPKLRKKTCFGPVKSLFSFSTDQAEKNSLKKLGKTRFVVWWFDVTNKIIEKQTFRDLSYFWRGELTFFMHVEHPNVTIWIVVVEIWLKIKKSMYPQKLSCHCDARNTYNLYRQ